MAHISPSQLRAARALLNWSRADLASKANVSEQTIHRVENGTNEPSAHTSQKLINALENDGIAFTENHGVRFKTNNIDVFEGADRFRQFYDFIYEHTKLAGGDICVGGVDEKLFLKHQGNWAASHMERMKQLHLKRNHFKMRILVVQGDRNFIASTYAEYRWLPKDNFAPTSFYAFGENLALISFNHEPTPYVVLHKSSPFAEAYRRAFNIAWESGTIPPKKL